MLKLTLEITEDKKNDKCIVKMINPKQMDKGTEKEKTGLIMISGQIEKALKEIAD